MDYPQFTRDQSAAARPENCREESVSDLLIAERLNRVTERIQNAAERAGRDPNEITLVAVSKKKPCSAIRSAYQRSVRDFGENYVQELQKKQESPELEDIASTIRWHMIGHLQKNKIRPLIGHTVLIHSVDTLSLAEAIEKEAAKQDRPVEILMEVNVAGEVSKWGFRPEEVLSAAKSISALPHLRLAGLMTSAPATENPEENRPFFRTLKQLADSLNEAGVLSSCDPGKRLPVLSMGMTKDFEVAVEEGATVVRIGTAIFGERQGGAL